jgi:hypothetical protein
MAYGRQRTFRGYGQDAGKSAYHWYTDRRVWIAAGAVLVTGGLGYWLLKRKG